MCMCEILLESGRRVYTHLLYLGTTLCASVSFAGHNLGVQARPG